ncbi:MAG: hypothetical protein KIS87_04840 [Phycisphaeraceae bacterium]|nr:hypothetical protein [Phycisphaeraceae bacterium]
MQITIDDVLLCRLTGELWAVFVPWRRPWTGGGPAAVYFARRAFHEGSGLRWRHSGRDRDERDENVEALGRLERAGLLRRRVERTKVVAVQLEEAGIERACALAGACGWRAGWETCASLARHEAEGAEEMGLRWVPEWLLAGTPPHWRCCVGEAGRENRQRLAALEARAIPALVLGWLESAADLYGRVWYALADPGRCALAETPPDEVSGVERDDECDLAWREGAHAMYTRMATAPRSEREIGLLPLPASLSAPLASRGRG